MRHLNNTSQKSINSKASFLNNFPNTIIISLISIELSFFQHLKLENSRIKQ